MKANNLFKNFPLGIVYQNTEGKIIDANKIAENILGLSIRKIRGGTLMDPMWKLKKEDGTNLPEEEYPSIIALQTCKPVKDVVIGILNQDTNNYIWVKTHAVPEFKGKETKPFQVYIVFSDIIKHSKSEKKIHNHFKAKKQHKQAKGKYHNSIFELSQDLNYRTAKKGCSERKKTEKLLFKNTHMQNLVSNLDFKQKNLREINKTVTNSLMEFGKFVNADRAYIFSYNWERNTASNTFEWCKQEISSQKEKLQDIPLDNIQNWVETHKQGKAIIIPNISLMHQESELFNILYPQNIKSLITIPLLNETNCYGFVGFDYVKRLHKPGKKEIEVLEIFGNMIANFTERQKAHHELLQEKQRFSNFIEATNVGTWEWNIQNGKTIFNERWSQIIGYTSEELAPTNIDTWTQFVHLDDKKLSNRLLEEHFSGKTNFYQCEVRMRHKNGNWVWILDVGKVISWTEDGNPLLMSGTHMDITPLKTYEKELGLINYLNLEMNSGVSLDRILQISVEKIIEELNFIHCDIYNYSSGDNFITIAAQSLWNSDVINRIEKLVNLKSKNHEIPLFEGSGFKEVIQKKQSVLIKNPEKAIKDFSNKKSLQTFAKSIAKMIGFKHVIRIPLMISNEVIGILGVTSLKEFSETSIKTLERIGGQVAVLIQKASKDDEMRKNEKKLDLAVKNLRQLIETANAPIFIVDKNGTITEWNNRVAQITGYSKEEALGTNFVKKYISNDFKERINQVLKNVLNGDEISNFEFPIYSKNKKSIILLLNASPRKNINGNIIGVLGVSQDITELKNKEEEILAIANYTYDWESWFAPNGKLLWVNPAVTTLTGFSAEECFKMPNYPIDILKNEDRKTFNKYFQQALKEQTSVNDYDFRIIHKNGLIRWMSISWLPIYNNDNEYTGLRTSIRDITERKKIWKELITAKEKAEESDHLKSAFLATMNHELRTPLNHILGFSSLIPDMTDDEGIKEFAKLIHSSGSNLLSIIEDIFDLAMVEQSEINIRNNIVYIRDIYIELKKELQEVLNASKKSDTIRLTHKIESRTASLRIFTDKPKVMQVMLNFIKNAVKYTHKGTIGIELSLNEENFLLISVKDTGIGIPKDKQHLIFEFFRQGDDSHTREYGGVGIGLAISQKIANAMNGEIILNSELGKGSTFTFKLPIKRLDIEETIFLDTILENSKKKSLDLSGKKILLVEDDKISSKMTYNMLSSTNCETLLAYNGAESLEQINKNPNINLILMDLKMPVMDGLLATQEIRKTNKDIPIIAFTANSLSGNLKKAMEAGCNDVITKPINEKSLIKKLRKYLLK